MLLTVTLNPSVDISYRLDKLKLDKVNRTSYVSKTAGGKGLNVTRVAHLLGTDVLATGILGGSLGDFIEKQLNLEGIKHNFLHSDQETRNCIAILHENMQTEILETGPLLSESDQKRFLDHFESLLGLASLVSISGSVARGLSENIYSHLIATCNVRNIPVILDTSGKYLETTLKNSDALPYLIKPNRDELSALLQRKIGYEPEQLMKALSHPIFNGVPWVIVTLGSKGAFARHGDRFYMVHIPKISVVNPVGSGDAVVAGFAKALESHESDENLLKFGMAAGMLNTMESRTGFVDASKFDQTVQMIQVEKL